MTMKTFRITSPLLWMLALLLAFIPVLAWLQWHWIGEIADREAERLRVNVRTTSTYAAWSFSQRIIALQQAFPISGATEPSRYAHEIDQMWHDWKQANDTLLVKSISIVSTNPRSQEAEMFAFNQTSGKLVLVNDSLHKEAAKSYNTSLPVSRMTNGLRALVIPILPKRMIEDIGLYSGKTQRQGSTPFQGSVPIQGTTPFQGNLPFRGGSPFQGGLPMPNNRTNPASEAPQPNTFPPGGNMMMMRAMLGGMRVDMLVIELDSAYLRQRFIPSLLKPYFQKTGYHWAVFERTNGTLLSAYDNAISPNDFATPDFTAPFGFVPPRAPGNIGRALTSVFSQLPLALANEQQSHQDSSSPEEIAPSEKITGIDSAIVGNLLGTTELRVIAAEGSVEGEVMGFRRRNLAVSFGILLVLTVGLVVVFMAVARSERLAVQQMRFVAGVSHELRTPLAVLHSASENMADGIVKTPEQVRKYGQVMKGEIARLVEMTEQTLTFAGIQSGKKRYDFHPTDLQALIDEVLRRNHDFLIGEGFAVDFTKTEALPLVAGDAKALSSALENLISNAVKYSLEKPKICITTSVVGAMVCVSVQDFGRGVLAKEQKRIFEPFYRTSEAVDAQIHGNGLGLSIVQHIVKQHGGFVSVESEVGKGSIFRLHLPLPN